MRNATTAGMVLDRLGGKPDLSVAKKIPEVPYAPLETDYSLDHPELPGLPLSHNTVVMTFTAGTSTAEANRVFASANASFVTGVASDPAGGTGVVILKLPANNHTEMEAALAALRAEPSVELASCDVLLEPTSVPPPNGNNPSDWNWHAVTGGGNWGFKMSRIPQMWNLNDGLHKRGHVAASGDMGVRQSSELRDQRKLTVTGIIDAGFFIAHPDLAIIDWPGSVPRRDAHGTHVAATIGAFFSDGTGVEGVNPFRYFVVSGNSVVSVGPLGGRTSWAASFILDLGQLVSEFPDTRVVNMSLAYNWYKTGTDMEPPINPATDFAVPVLTSIHGGLFDALLRSIDNPPLIFAAAGNDDNKYSETILAKDGSPMANAGLEWENPNVVVVEAIYELAGAPSGAWRAPYSNQQGHISAPGGHPRGPRILSAVDPDDLKQRDPPMEFGVDHDYLHGTSMATPHVTGLAIYLFTLDPDLTNAEVLGLILSNVLPAGGEASPRIDAVAAAMAIDDLRGNDEILTMLVDIDDGTVDGNTRVEAGTATIFLNEDSDGDGGMGDGKVDMSDFRRLRDWMLDAVPEQFTEPANDERVLLDGAADHPKRDLNGNGLTPASENALFEDENVFPRGDFNGDGRLSQLATAFLPGFDDGATDLEVLKKLFDDPVYTKDDLELTLFKSYDLHVDPSRCFEEPGVAEVRTSIRIPGNDSGYKEYTHTSADDIFVYTIPYDRPSYIARAVALSAQGEELQSLEKELDLASRRYGHDQIWKPNCVGELFMTVTFPGGTPLERDEINPVRIRVEMVSEDGSFSPVANAQLDILYVADDARRLLGTTDGEGYVEESILADADVITLQIEASHPDGSAGYFFRDYETESTTMVPRLTLIPAIPSSTHVRTTVKREGSTDVSTEEPRCGSFRPHLKLLSLQLGQPRH